MRTPAGALTVALSFALSFALCVSACTDGTGPSPPRVDSLAALPRALTATEQQAIRAGNAFALALLREADARAPGRNVLLSPLSVSLALGMTMNGATGRTLSEMQTTLGWGTRTRDEINPAYRDLMTWLPSLDSTVTIRMANGIWMRSPLVPDSGFASDARRFFNAEARSVATPQAMFDSVNAWGREQTQGMVPRVLDTPPPAHLAMLLANAVYFGGTWRDRFVASETQPGPFRLESGTLVQVPLMHRRGRFVATQTTALTAIALPYGNTAYNMLVLVPASEAVSGLIARLDSATLAGIVSGLRPVGDAADLSIPRFTVSTSIELKPHLSAMGMPTAFSDLAEFPRLFGSGAKLEFVRHGVTLEVNEKGTRAAAVTVVGVVPVSAPQGYRVDRPFVFVIRDRFAGTILFAGVVRDPRQ